MTQIIGGSCMYGRTVKTGEYENKKAEARLEFTVEDGEDFQAVFDQAANSARAQVQRLLGLKPDENSLPKNHDTQAADLAGVTVSGDKEKIAASRPATALPAVPSSAARRPGRPPKLPAQEAPIPPAEKPVDVMDETLFQTTVPAITDEELYKKIGVVNGAIQNPKKIRELIAKYVAHPGQARDISVDIRPKFISELEAFLPQ